MKRYVALFAMLITVLVGISFFDLFAVNSNLTLKSNEQLALSFQDYIIPFRKTNTPEAARARLEDSGVITRQRCKTDSLDLKKSDVWLLNQLIVVLDNEKKLSASCATTQAGEVQVSLDDKNKKICRVYEGKDKLGATSECPTAAVANNPDTKEPFIICWHDNPEVTCLTPNVQGLTGGLENGLGFGSSKKSIVDDIKKQTPLTPLGGSTRSEEAFSGSGEQAFSGGGKRTVVDDIETSGASSSNKPEGASGAGAQVATKLAVAPPPVPGALPNAGNQPKVPNTQSLKPPPRIPFKSLQPLPQPKPESFIQRFAGGELLNGLANFIKRGADVGASRGTETAQAPKPQVVFVNQTQGQVEASAVPQKSSAERIKELASGVSFQTPQTLARVDHFAQTLQTVGGPNAINTQNESFGRIQDFIIEDEAIRSLRVAEEEGKRAKNEVFCRPSETADACLERREERQKEKERETFVAELESRVLPESAIEHFLAVYDGWVRPSPAPATKATSTLGALFEQENETAAQYEFTTDGSNFVAWVVESISGAIGNAANTLTNLLLGVPNDPDEQETPE